MSALPGLMMPPGLITIGGSPPVVIGTNSNGVGNVASIAIALPGDVEEGDLLLILAAGQITNARTFTPPAGFTPLFNQAGPGNLRFFCAAWKEADGSEEGSVTGTVDSNTRMTAQSYRIGNWQGEPEASAVATGTSDVPNPPSLTPSWGDAPALWLAVGATNPASIQDPPDDYTNLLSQDDTGGPFVSLFSARRVLKAGTENPGSFSVAQTSVAAATIAIRGR